MRMTNVFSVQGSKAGEQIFFKAEFAKSNFFNLIDLIGECESIEDVKELESKGLFKII